MMDTIKKIILLLAFGFSLESLAGGITEHCKVLSPGVERTLEELYVGSSIISCAKNGDCQDAKVVDARKSFAYTITLSLDQQMIETTLDQKIMTPYGWVNAIDLQVGDLVVTRTGVQHVVGSSISSSQQAIYSLVVIPNHNLYANGILIHNGWFSRACGKGTPAGEMAKALDPTNKNSAVRKMGKAIDPCNSQNTVSETWNNFDDNEKVAIGAVAAAGMTAAVVASAPAISSFVAATEVNVNVLACTSVGTLTAEVFHKDADSDQAESIHLPSIARAVEAEKLSSENSESLVTSAVDEDLVEEKPSVNLDPQTIEATKKSLSSVLSQSEHYASLGREILSPRSKALHDGVSELEVSCGIEPAEDGLDLLTPMGTGTKVTTQMVKKAQQKALGSARELATRKDAFRQAKRDAKVPNSQSPKGLSKEPMKDRQGKNVLDEKGKRILTREYEFESQNGKKIIIQEHSAGHKYREGGKGDQGPHFNVRPPENTRTGHVEGTRDHYNWQENQISSFNSNRQRTWSTSQWSVPRWSDSSWSSASWGASSSSKYDEGW